MATLINGNGNAAVYAQQDADWFRSIAGGVTQLMSVGQEMAYEIEDANTIAVKDGGIITKEGRRIQIDVGTIDEFLIPTGTQGTTNYYIIGYHLYRDQSSNELCDTFVQLMNGPTDTIQEDTFRGGATDVYVSLYRVTQDGLNIDGLELLLGTYKTTDDIEDELGTADISAIGDGTVKGAVADLNANLSAMSDFGDYDLLVDATSNSLTNYEVNDITDYRYLLMCCLSTAKTEIGSTSLYPTGVFKSLTKVRASAAAAFSSASAASKSAYIIASYVDDTHIQAQSGSDCLCRIYGIK